MTDDERKLLKYVKEVSAPQLLADMSGGKVLGTDLRTIGKLKIYRLPDEVRNVLLYWAKHERDKQTDYKNIYKTAARWSRLRIKTAEEAFEAIKKEGGLSQKDK